MTEKDLFSLIKERILTIQQQTPKPIRVAINGIEGTGKTTFAAKLCEYLITENINAIHVSIDGFHFNREVRYRQGRDSTIGYYEYSYDEQSFVEKVLQSSQSEFPNYTIATHNLETDEYLHLEPIALKNDAVLITDGAYLFKPILRAHWDLKIYLKTSFEVAMSRGIERDRVQLGGVEQAKEKYEKRYHKSSQLYITQNNPEEIADIIIDNTNFNNLKLTKNTDVNNTRIDFDTIDFLSGKIIKSNKQ